MDDVADALGNRRRRVLVAAALDCISAQGAEDLVVLFLQRAGAVFEFEIDGRRVVHRSLDLLEPRGQIVGGFQGAGDGALQADHFLLELEEQLAVFGRHAGGALDNDGELLLSRQRCGFAFHALGPGNSVRTGHDERASGRLEE